MQYDSHRKIKYIQANNSINNQVKVMYHEQ